MRSFSLASAATLPAAHERAEPSTITPRSLRRRRRATNFFLPGTMPFLFVLLASNDQ